MSRNERRAKQLFGCKYPYKREKKRLVNKFRNVLRSLEHGYEGDNRYRHGITVYTYEPKVPFYDYFHYSISVYTSKPKQWLSHKKYLRNTFRYVYGIYN